MHDGIYFIRCDPRANVRRGDVENLTSQLRDGWYQIGIFSISHILTPCLQKRGMHLPYRQFAFFPALPDPIYEEVDRRASSPKRVFLEEMFIISTSGRHLGKYGRRTIFGVIRPGYVIRHDTFRRKRISRTQRARKTKVGKWVERATCKGRSDDKRHGRVEVVPRTTHSSR